MRTPSLHEFRIRSATLKPFGATIAPTPPLSLTPALQPGVLPTDGGPKPFQRFPMMSLFQRLLSILVALAGLAIPMHSFAESMLLHRATVHTISGQVFAPGDVLIRDGKIEAVADHLDSKADVVVDLQGQHLYPGLIALDTALGLSEISGVRATLDTTETGDFVPDVQSWIAVNPDSELIPVARANGITFVEPAPQGSIVAGQSGLIVLNGWTTEQMAFKTPAALHLYWPTMDLNLTPKQEFKDKTKWKSIEDQARERTFKLNSLDEFFADARAYAQARDVAGKNGTPGPLLNPSWEAMRPFVCGKLPVVVHAEEIRQIKAAVAWAATNHVSMILAGGRDAWMAADLLASQNIAVIYESVFTQPARESESYDVHFAAPAVLQKAGVKVVIGLGADPFQAGMLRNLPYAAAQAVAFGLPPEEALRAVTLYPAQLLGVADRLGAIEPGKDATFFSSNGDILDLRSNVKHLWIAGKEIALDTRHTRLYQKYKNRPKGK